MAHHRWTLALILICIPILATVISAFRVRDLPKSNQENEKIDLKKQKCEDCDINELKGSKLHIAKIESVKRYDELKKATREKMQSISQKNLDSKSSFNLKNFSDEDDDDENESVDFVSSDAVTKHGDRQTVSKEEISASRLKLEIKTKKPVSIEKKDSNDESNDDDDDEDDDDDDDDDDITISIGRNIKLGNIKSVEKTSKPISNPPKNVQIPKFASVAADGAHDYDDDSDEEDDSDDIDSVKKQDQLRKSTGSVIINVKKLPGTKSTSNKLVVKSTTESGDNIGDDDEDDDDSYENNVLKLQKKRLGETSKQPTKESKNIEKSIDKPGHNNDDDDDDDDDNEDNDNEVAKPKQKPQTKTEATIETVKKNSKSDGKSISIDFKNDQLSEKSKEKQEGLKQKSEKTDQGLDKENKSNKKLVVQNKDSTIDKEKSDGQDIKKPSKSTKSDIPSVNTEKDNKNESNNKKNAESERKKDSQKKEETKIKPSVIKDKDEVKKAEKKADAEIKKKEEKPTKPMKDIKPETAHKKNTGKEQSKKDKLSKETLFDSREMFPKSESNLKHVTDALQRRNLLQSEFEDFYAFFPTFAPNFSRIHNPECRRHGQIVLRQLRGTKLWAFSMLDATAKIPSGLLQGNGIQLGDYDQCLNSRARVQLESGSVVKVQGQYCLASLDVKAEHPDLELPVHLVQAKNLIKSRVDDPGHFVPRFSTLSWGVCMPTACAPEDVEVVLKDALKHYQHTSGLVVRVKVDPRDCHTQNADWWDDWLELPTLLTLSLYAVVILVVFIATLQDFFARRKSEKTENSETDDQAECDQKETKDEEEVELIPENKDGVFNAFSLYRSVGKLVAPCTDDEVACIHGIRGVATLALLIAHKFLPVAVTPYTNRLKITEIVSSPLWSWCRAGWVFTDCFLLLSGTLTAHRKVDDSSAPWRLFQRYIRLTPALLAVVLFYAYIWDNISEGPMWGTLVTKNAEVCQEGWWWNLLYVQNYFGFEDMCAPQTHQLALDMQLTIIGIAIVWAIQSEIPFSKFTIPVIMIIASYSRYSVVQEHRLTMLAYHGVSVSQLYRTARLSYTSTLHRSTPYLIGLSLGLVLRKPRQHGKIVLSFGWLISTTLWGLVWWAGMDAGSTQYRYNAGFAAQYASLAPIASAVALAWVVYTVHGGQCDWLARLLSCRFLAFISRLSYALYLSQFIVFLTNAATVRASTEFNLMSLVDAQEISAVLLLSIVLTLTFVIPMQSIHKLFSFSLKSEKESSGEKEVEEKAEGQENKSEGIEESPEPPEENYEEINKVPTRSRQHFIAHREVLEEIPEIEIEYEMQRERNDGLEEILEEEEDEEPEERADDDDDELEIIEEEQGGEDDLLEEQEAPLYRRPYSRNDDDNQDLDEWEWTTNGNGRYGAQYYRYTR